MSISQVSRNKETGLGVFIMAKRTNHSNQETSSSSKSETVKSVATAATIGVTTAAGAYVGYKYGFLPDFLDKEISPQPTTIPEVVGGMVTVNEGLRSAAPFVAIGAIATSLYFSVSGRMNKKQRTLNKLSKVEYSGVDEINHSKRADSHSVIGKTIEKGTKFRKGRGVAALAILLTSATSGIEHEVSNGPLRPIDAMYTLADPTATANTMLLQGEANTFMDDSTIDSIDMGEVVAAAALSDITIIPFNKVLMNINDKSALQISFPDEVFSQMSGVTIDANCETVPVIVDETVGAKVGETIDINGVDAQVIGVEDNLAQMNRSIAIVSDTDMRDCLKDGTDASYFGAIVPNANEQQVREFLADNNLQFEFGVTSEEEFKENNRDFWRANGTPVLLQLIAYIAIFGGFAAAGERKSALQRNAREIGMLNAAGVTMKDIRGIEDRRALRDTLVASIIAAPAMPVLAAAFNAAELGMKVGVGPRELAVGGAVTLGAKLIASRRAVNNFEKNLDLPQAVKG